MEDSNNNFGRRQRRRVGHGGWVQRPHVLGEGRRGSGDTSTPTNLSSNCLIHDRIADHESNNEEQRLTEKLWFIWVVWLIVRKCLAERVRPVTMNFWESIALQLSEEGFQKRFRLSKSCFWALAQQLRPYLKPNRGTGRRYKYGAKKQLGVFIYRIAERGGRSVQSICDTWGLSQGSVVNITNKVCKGLISLEALYRPQPLPDVRLSNILGWNIVGYMDGTLHEVWNPGLENICRKGTLCMNTLGVADGQLRFIFIHTGYHGSVADGRIQALSGFNDWLMKNSPNAFCVADSGLTNSPQVVTQFEHGQTMLNTLLSRKKRYFNRIMSALKTVERAWGMFEVRFQVFKGALPFESFGQATKVARAAFVLHNAAISFNSPVSEEEMRAWLEERKLPATPLWEKDMSAASRLNADHIKASSSRFKFEFGALDDIDPANVQRMHLVEQLWARHPIKCHTQCGTEDSKVLCPGPFAKRS